MLLSAQKINFSPHFFLEILQRFCKLVISVTFSMAEQTPKLIVLTCRKMWCLSACQKTKFIHLFRDIANISQTYYYGYFGHAWKLKTFSKTAKKQFWDFGFFKWYIKKNNMTIPNSTGFRITHRYTDTQTDKHELIDEQISK